MTVKKMDRPFSQHLFPSQTSPQSSPKNQPAPRIRLPSSHYRPISQLISEENAPKPLSRQTTKSRRTSSIHFLMSFHNHSFLDMVQKPKDKGKETRLRKVVSSSPEFPKDRPGLYTNVDGQGQSASSPKAAADDVTCRHLDDYVAKKVWHRRENMKLHPYPEDAVYMQSYDPILLESEKYSYRLLSRLTSSIPTFNTSMESPPSRILDLGCGQGHWLLDAANVWPSAEFVGFDLVDILVPEVRQKSNVQLVRGNFTRYPLPFSDKTFDFIRMANLSLAIPHDKWNFVLSEVRRVLQVGGELELIDDEIHFPYGSHPNYATTPLASPDSMQNTSTSGPLDTCSNHTLINHASYETEKYTSQSTTYSKGWLHHSQISQEVETTFINTLQRLSINPHSSEFVPDLLRYTFGGGNVHQTQEYKIKTAPAPSFSRHRSPKSPPSHSRASIGSETDRSEKSYTGTDISETTSIGPYSASSISPSAKAAFRLGISYSDLVMATAASTQQSMQHMDSLYTSPGLLAQPSGIIVSPARFIALDPIETEYHASKWIHNLLGCKPAIAQYVRSFIDEKGKRVVSDAELNDSMWTYESFRRQRFHWAEPSDTDDDAFPTSPCIPNTRNVDLRQVIGTQQCNPAVHIRTIRVYHATRTEMTSLASLLFQTTPPSKSKH